MSKGRMIVVAVLLLAVGAVACAGGAQKPSVEILSPPSGSQVALGEEVQVQYRASDATAVTRVDLEVGGHLADSQNSPVPDGQPVMTGVLNWTAEQPGEYTLIVYAYNKERVASDPVGVAITVGDGGAVPGSTVTISLILPGSTATTEATEEPGGSATVPPATATKSATTQPATPSPTRPAATPTATRTTPPPTATHQQAAPPPPPTATATKPPPSPTPTVQLANLWVENHTSVDICEVYFSPPSEPWGPNKLLGGNRIYAGQSALWTIPAGVYDLWALDCAGNGLVVVSNQSIYTDWTWEINPTLPPPPPPAEPLSLTLVNQTADAICELYMYHTPDWPDRGPNQVAGYCIPVGGMQTFGIESGDWTFDAFDSTSHWLSSWQGYLPGGMTSIDLY